MLKEGREKGEKMAEIYYLNKLVIKQIYKRVLKRIRKPNLTQT